MFRNYIKVAYRIVQRQKLFSLLNVTGLASGITCSILILLWVDDEIHFDTFFKNTEKIFRVYELQYYSGKEVFPTYATPYPLCNELKNKYPAIENAVRFSPLWKKMIVKANETVFNESRIYAADPWVFDIFDYDFILGNPKAALVEPYSIVLTEKMAKKYFGDENPLNKTISISKWDFKVTSVLKDNPSNTHISFDFIIPFSFFADFYKINLDSLWDTNSFNLYIQLKNVGDHKLVENQIKDIIKSKVSDPKIELFLQPLKDSHLYSILGKTGQIQYVRIFSLVAVLVLIIACINFMNLSTARSGKRAKEIGMRKVIGATRFQVISQYMGESFFLTILALVLGLFMAEILIPFFNKLTFKDLELNYFEFRLLAGIIVIVILTGFFSGSYPSLFLSSFKPGIVLKGFHYTPSSGLFFRKILVIFQFSLSIGLIICTLIIYKQLNFIRNKDIGLKKDCILYIEVKDLNKGYTVLKRELMQNGNILNVTACNQMPSNIGNSTSGVTWEGKPDDTEILFQMYFVDYDYFETFQMQMAEGRSFSDRFPEDTANFIINEETANRMEIKSPLGLKIKLWDDEGQIIGIVKNFNFRHLSNEIEPLLIVFGKNQLQYLVVKFRPENTIKTIESIGESFNRIYPNVPFEYSLFEQDFDEIYRSEIRMGQLFQYFSFLAILISCLGLFGLSSFMTEQRTKEIGIRKTMGSSITEVLLLLSKDFSKWILIAFVVASPLSWYFMNLWLQGFAYRTNIDVWIFLIALSLSLIITILTISYQSIKIATLNPTKSLRYE